MGLYAVRGYYETGFDAINIPDSLALLNQFRYKDFGNLDLLQERNLTTIRLPGSWEEVSDIDYLKVGSDSNGFYYSCTPIMTSGDTVAFSLVPDYVLSASNSAGTVGIRAAVNGIIGGMTSRFIPTDDTLGYYEESDALLAPALPLNILQQWHNPGGTSMYNFVESTIDLVATGTKDYATVCYNEDNSVVIPAVEYIDSNTTYTLSGQAATSDPVSRLYNIDDPSVVTSGVLTVGQSVKRGINKARVIGVEDGIRQHLIPKNFVKPTYSEIKEITYSRDGILKRGSDSYITSLAGESGSFDSGIPYDYTSQGSSVVWQRILTSEYTKFGLVTASGESCEYNPADILQSSKPTNAHVRWIADPRPDGRPYFRFLEVNSDSSAGANFFRSSVSGLNWKQVSILYTTPSGTALNILNYNNSRRIADTNVQHQLVVPTMNMRLLDDISDPASEVIMQMRDTATGVGRFFKNLGAQSTTDSLINLSLAMNDVGGGGLYGITSLEYAMTKVFNEGQSIADAYRAQKQQELSTLAVQTQIAVPTVTVPYNSEIIRDFYGNGVLAYRFVYDGRDIARINKLLSMYGYKHTKPIEASDFYGHRNFDYVECQGLSITGFNRSFCEGITAQLTNGVRVWHVKPDKKYYENKSMNPNA